MFYSEGHINHNLKQFLFSINVSYFYGKNKTFNITNDIKSIEMIN